MKTFISFSFITIIFLKHLFISTAAGVPEKALLLKYKNGICFYQDSSFSLILSTRIQNRIGYLADASDLSLPEEMDFRVRRARLKLKGEAFRSRLAFNIQFSFSRADQDWDVSLTPNVLRDAMIWYRPSKSLQLGIGQGKLPGNRQRQISSGEQEFTDRSIANADYTLDRDVGIFIYHRLPLQYPSVHLKSAITAGEGRNALVTDRGLAYTTRLEILPLGEFHDQNDYTEGDLFREPSPKISLGLVAHYNDRSRRTQGQLGKALTSPHYYASYIADLLFKYKGFAWSSEFLYRGTNTVSDPSKNYVVAGYGYHTQISYVTTKKFGFGGRYAATFPDVNLTGIAKEVKQYCLVFNRFISEHRIKLQWELQHLNYTVRHPADMSVLSLKEKWAAFFQVECGL